METLLTAEHGVFAHERLKLGGNSIRLITLHHDFWNAPIHCSITQYAQHRQPEYIALSYMWGPEDDNYSIFLNNKPFRVRKNLYDCLRQLRQSHNPTVTLWVDALCIDQTNIQERNHIVQLMDQVYTKAEKVYVWLGEGDESSDRAMSFLRDTAVALSLSDTPIDTFLDSYLFPTDHTQCWIDVVLLFKREYWTRLWIVQETLLAREIEIFCGDCHVSWNHVEKVVLLSRDSFVYYERQRPTRSSLHAAILDALAARMVLRRCDSVQFSGKRSSYPTLQTLLETFKDSVCYDSRDEIFGLLSIASDYFESRVDYIDYNQRPTEVFVNFVKNYVAANRSQDDDECLFNIRRLSDALRLSVPTILRSRNQDLQARASYTDLTTNHESTTLTLKCKVLFRLVDVNEEMEDPKWSCHLREFNGLSPTSSWRSSSPGSKSPTSATSDSTEDSVRLSNFALLKGYQVCNAMPSSGTNLLSPTGDQFSSTGVKLFTKAADENDMDVSPVAGLVCTAARPGDFLVQTDESEVIFVARHCSDEVYDIVGTAAIHEEVGSLMKIKSHMRKFWNHHHRSQSTSALPHHRRGSHEKPGIRHMPLPEVRFNPLMLLIIVNEPSWRQDRIRKDFRAIDRQPTSYAAIQPRGEHDPILKYYGPRFHTGSSHLDRMANRLRDRTNVTLEEIRELKHDLKEHLG